MIARNFGDQHACSHLLISLGNLSMQPEFVLMGLSSEAFMEMCPTTMEQSSASTMNISLRVTCLAPSAPFSPFDISPSYVSTRFLVAEKHTNCRYFFH
jgi:hypothetical protein